MNIIKAPLLNDDDSEDKVHALTRGITNAVTIKDGELFMLTNERGEIPLKSGHGLGIYLHDMRFLSGYSLRLNGTAMECLGVVRDGGQEVVYHMGNFSMTTFDGTTLDKLSLGLDWKRRLDGHNLALEETLSFRSYLSEAVDIPLTLRFDAQFRDIFQVRGMYPDEQGVLHEPVWKEDSLILAYDGLDGVRRETRVSFSLPAARRSQQGVEFDLHLPPHGQQQLSVTLRFKEGGDEGMRTPRSTLTDRVSRYATISSTSLYVGKLVDRSMSDLRLLLNQRDGHDYYAAGLPWFGVVFGRDSLITAMMTLPYQRSVAESTLRLLATLQGREHNEANEEEPGRIPHELRCGELARSGRLKKSPDYGTIDATPLFLILFREHARWTGSTAVFEELHESVELALSWIDARMERFGGWLAYQSCSEHSCHHQGWKDVDGAIVRKDGTVPHTPIALVEVQGLVYAAWLGCAELYRRAGQLERAERLEEKARDLRRRFARAFWLEDGQYLAMALEKGGVPVEIVTSNMGQALWTGIVDSEHARHVVRHLMDESNFCGWGIRTMSSKEKTYCPFGYHNGGVWPHDNALIAAGMKRYGFEAEAERVTDAIIEAAFHFPLERLPELFCGYSKRHHATPISYPTACHPQAWSSASVPSMLATSVGLEPDAFARTLVVRKPRLPWTVPDLVMKGIKVGDSAVDLTFRRHNGFTEVCVDRVHGDCRVVIWPRQLM